MMPKEFFLIFINLVLVAFAMLLAELDLAPRGLVIFCMFATALCFAFLAFMKVGE